jgi:pantoate--beta-alanine ligase
MATIVHTPRELFAATEAYRKAEQRVGFVPTMGALHDGHLSLVSAARDAGAKRCVVSIFVNPLQFGPTEDLSKYPRTFEDDRKRCEAAGVDLIYAPDPSTMYPTGFQTHVEVEQITKPLEGTARPTHFRGVTTVVAKLFNAVGPCVAAFGRKDYQQWRTLERMVRDLDMPIEVLGCPILREPDGLAMSSRNRYLEPGQRTKATAIHRGLCVASAAFARGERSVSTLTALARDPIEAVFDSIDYVTIADASDVQPAMDTAPPHSVMLVAARLGNTRLIDNAVLGQECLVPG